MKKYLVLAPAALIAAPASAQSFELLGEVTYADYSDGMGERTEGSVLASADFGATAIVLEGKVGERKFEDESFSGTSGSIDLYHDWNDALTTRTTVGFGSDDPVFVNRTLGQEVMVKPVRDIVLTAGVSFREYFGDVDATAYSFGPTWYFKGGFVRYTYTHYDIEHRGNTHSHLATLRLNDRSGGGYTQAWLGTGTSIQEYEFFVPETGGEVTGISLRRVQPLSKTLALTLNADRQWSDTPLFNYTRWGVTGGIRVNW